MGSLLFGPSKAHGTNLVPWLPGSITFLAFRAAAVVEEVVHRKALLSTIAVSLVFPSAGDLANVLVQHLDDAILAVDPLGDLAAGNQAVGQRVEVTGLV